MKSATRNTQYAITYLVRWFPGDYPVQFHQRGFSLVPEDEATTFDHLEKAMAAVKRITTMGGARGGDFTVTSIGKPQAELANAPL